MNTAKRPDNFTGLWTDAWDPGRTEQHYINGVANGPYRSILENGVSHREGTKKNGLWHGMLIVRDSSGCVLDKTEFVEGTGVYRIFNSDGKLTDEMPMARGKLHGTVRSFRRDKFATTRFYTNGQCDAAICGTE